jgi:hypothetical protein
MATECIAQVRFKFEKDVVTTFDVPHASADGGAVLLKALDRQLGVTDAVASSLRDRRQPGKVQHEVIDLVRQRIFGGWSGSSAIRLSPPTDPSMRLSRTRLLPKVTQRRPRGPRAGE